MQTGTFQNRLNGATIGLPLGAAPPPGLYTGLETAYLGMVSGRRGAGDAAARLVRSGLREIGYRADLPLADLVDGGEVAEQFVAGDEAVGCSGSSPRSARSGVVPRPTSTSIRTSGRSHRGGRSPISKWRRPRFANAQLSGFASAQQCGPATWCGVASARRRGPKNAQWRYLAGG